MGVRGYLLTLACILLCACTHAPLGAAPPSGVAPTPERHQVARHQVAEEIVLYAWAGYIPPSIVDAFTAEHGIEVRYLEYETQEQAEADLRAGQAYDLVMMGTDFLPGLIADGLLAELDYAQVPNIKNLSPNFRDLVYDPGNRHSVIVQWGTTGIVVRTDLTGRAITRWDDLWDAQYKGRIGVWPIQRDLIGIALKSLGHSCNSEDPVALEAALSRLIELKRNVFFMDMDLATGAPYLADGRAVAIHGWTYDYIEARREAYQVAYVLPEEGTILWGEALVIPANALHKAGAHLFLNYLLRPEVGAMMVKELYIATTNEAALSYLPPEIRADLVLFPEAEDLSNAEITVPLSPAGRKLYEDIWARFMEVQE